MGSIQSTLDLLKSKSEKYSIDTAQIQNVSSKIKEFQVKIVFIGAFSAGKSALLNAFMNRDVLDEGQRPETTIASELLYDSTEYVEAFQNGAAQRCGLDEVKAFDVDKFDYLKRHLNNEALRDVKEYVLVDMPGFNSGIEAHNKAILRYANEANAYVLVLDVEDGGIRHSIGEFISEVRNYRDNLAVVITKTDLKSDEDVQAVQEIVEDLSFELFGGQVEVITTSSRTDPNVQEKMKQLIQKFDRESIFHQTFWPSVVAAGEQIISILKNLKKSSKLNTDELEALIAKEERARKELIQKLERERERLSDKMRNQVCPTILSDAEDALNRQADALASSLESGGVNFSRLVNNILRPVLVSSTRMNVEGSFDDFVDEFDMGNLLSNHDSEDACSDILDRYKNINNKLKNLPESAAHFEGAYKAITTALAVTTSVVAPWLELVLIFLPEILGAISIIFRGDLHEQAREKVTGEIIPQIIQRLEPGVAQSLQEIESDLMQQMEERINDMVDLETSTLENAKEQLKKKQENFASSLNEIDADIAEIQAVLDEI